VTLENNPKPQQKSKNMKKEIRFLAKAELRAKGDSKTISGYASVFNSLSQDLGGFKEVIKPGAFTRCLQNNPDVRCLFNHNPDAILGRTTSGTLRLSEDATGLHFECEMPDTQASNDLRISIQRGDINQCSFGFVCGVDNWLPLEAAPGILREVIEAAELFDVSPVVYPAYTQTSLSTRSLFPEGLPSGAEAALRKARVKVVLDEHRQYLEKQDEVKEEQERQRRLDYLLLQIAKL
jgi:uncharacterized protein